jgi:D-3-phosphoglycerate dehydrogenase / 2-oxoglutarate reductase
MTARVGYLADAVLYADLRQRLEEEVELVDLTHLDRSRIAAEVPQIDMVLHHPKFDFDAQLIALGDRLRAVLAPGAGFDGIAIEAATPRGILVTHQAGCNDEAVAEHALGLMLSISKRIAAGDRLMRRTTDWQPGAMHNHEIGGKTLGIIGLGAIGRRLAEIATRGFRMRVMAYDPFVDESPLAGVDMADLQTVLGSSDVVSVHVPLNQHTRGLLGARELGLMQPHAILINTSRGFVVDQDALTATLVAGRLAGAGLDVFDDDVLPLDHPLLQLDTVVVTPHCAGGTYESLADQARRQGEAVLALVRAEPPKTARILNPEAVEAFQERFRSL